MKKYFDPSLLLIFILKLTGGLPNEGNLLSVSLRCMWRWNLIHNVEITMIMFWVVNGHHIHSQSYYGCLFNTFIPAFLKWTFPAMYLDMSTDANRVSVKNQNENANSVDPNETASYKPFYLDLHCLHIYLFQSSGLKGLTYFVDYFDMQFTDISF